MTQHRSINETLDLIAKLDGQAVEVEGILGVSFDGMRQGYELLHYPKAERRDDRCEDGQIHLASLWLEFGDGSIRPNGAVLARWAGKRVRVHGVVNADKSACAHPAFDGGTGVDPWGILRAHIEVYSIQRVTSEQRKESGA
jgi:hypothetical protein